MNRDELFPVPDHPQKWIGVIIGCMLVSWFMLVVGIGQWVTSSETPTAWPGTYSNVKDTTTYTYSELIKDYEEPTESVSSWFFVYPITYLVLQVIAISLVIYIARGCLLYILANAFILFISGTLCFGAAASRLGDSTTYLCHQQTVEFEGEIYQLTIEKHTTSDLYTERWRVLLFRCDATGDQCSVRFAESDYRYNEEPEASIEIDAESGALEMVVDGEQVYEIPPAP
jgi:hypothetical protein